MRRYLSLLALGFLAACAPLLQQVPSGTGASVSSISTATGDLAVTPEPFAEPLAPTTVTGSIVLQERTLSGGILEVGDARAGLTMTVFLNVESPYAREFARTKMPLLMQEFVEPGLLKIRLFILPINKYQGSELSARSLACSAEQGKGYPALARMIEKEHILLDAGDVDELGMDSQVFTVCNTDGRDVFTATRAAAERWNVTLVPTYVIGNDVHVGLPTDADLLGGVRAAL